MDGAGHVGGAEVKGNQIREKKGGGRRLGYDIVAVAVRLLPNGDRWEGLPKELCGRQEGEKNEIQTGIGNG